MTRRGTALRFAAVGVCNTVIDVGLFVLGHDAFGVTLANFISTSAGMLFSFVANGLFTFGAEKLTVRHALLFIATTGLVMWVVQPLLIHGWLWVLEQGPAVSLGPLGAGDVRIWAAKLASIACCLLVNFAAYRFVVWPVEHRGEGSTVPDER